MSETNPGARTWSARSIIAISATALTLLLPSVSALAEGGVERLLNAARSLAPGQVPSLAHVMNECAGDELCAARMVRDSLGPRARLERVKHPDTDTIRRVKSLPSLTGRTVTANGAIRLTLDRFGRTAVAEIKAALSGSDSHSRRIEIDLRGNRGGRLDRMLRVAALFLGPTPDAIRLDGPGGARMISIPDRGGKLAFRELKLIVGPDTASSAEIFAALMRARAGARIEGGRTRGKNWLLRVIAVNHDWRLLVPAETVTVPGAVIAGGIVPDAKL